MKKILILFLVMCSCTGKTALKETEGISIEVETAVKEYAAPEITAFGSVVYGSKAEVYPTTTSFIKEIYAEEGDFVTKGQVLAVIDDSRLRVQLEEAVSDFEAKQAAVRLASAMLEEGRRDTEKILFNIRELEIIRQQKGSEYNNMLRIYGNKSKLHEAGGFSSEELKSVKQELEKKMNELMQAENALESARIGYRITDLEKAGYKVPEERAEQEKLLVMLNTGVLQAELEVAQAEYRAAEAAVENIRLSIEETKIRAPVEGTIGKRYLDCGETVTPETALFTVFDMESVYVRTELNASHFHNVRPGQTVKLNILEEEFEGRIELISPYADPRTGGRSIRISVDNSGKKLYPGLFAGISVITGAGAERTFIPREAVKDNQVFVIRGEKAFSSKVDVEFITGDKAYISAGPEAGDRVAVTGLELLWDGCPVKAVRRGDR